MLLLCLSMVAAAASQSIADRFYPWTDNVKYPSSSRMQLTLDQRYAAGAVSKKSWTYGEWSVCMKLPAGNSAGTVTTFYMMSPQGDAHCEYDMEFLGNSTGQPYLLHTNVFVGGQGGREEQTYLGFDPTADFHCYKIRWSKDLVAFFVDDVVVRIFRNLEDKVAGFQYCKFKALGMHVSIWDGSSWATQGGRVPINWNSAPFVATYENFQMSGCEVNSIDKNAPVGCQSHPSATGIPVTRDQVLQMQARKASMMKYDYCTDKARYKVTPPECPFNNVYM